MSIKYISIHCRQMMFERTRSHHSRIHQMYCLIKFSSLPLECPLLNSLKVLTSVHIIHLHGDHLFVFIPHLHIDCDIGRTHQTLMNHLNIVV